MEPVDENPPLKPEERVALAGSEGRESARSTDAGTAGIMLLAETIVVDCSDKRT